MIERFLVIYALFQGLDSTRKCNKLMSKEYLIRCSEIKVFSGTSVEPIHNFGFLLRRDLLQIAKIYTKIQRISARKKRACIVLHTMSITP